MLTVSQPVVDKQPNPFERYLSVWAWLSWWLGSSHFEAFSAGMHSVGLTPA